MFETLLGSLRNGTGGPLLGLLIVGLNLAVGAAKDRAALQWWIAERPSTAGTVYGWVNARRHLTLCVWFGLVSALLAVAGIVAGSALPLWTVLPAHCIAWAVVTIGLAFLVTCCSSPSGGASSESKVNGSAFTIPLAGP